MFRSSNFTSGVKWATSQITYSLDNVERAANSLSARGYSIKEGSEVKAWAATNSATFIDNIFDLFSRSTNVSVLKTALPYAQITISTAEGLKSPQGKISQV